VNTPNVALMRKYGTGASFMAKTAHVQPIAHRMGQIILGRQLLQRLRASGPEVRHTAQAELMNTTFRMLELARMERTIDNANHAVAPIILPAGYGESLPIGMTEGMIRMASAIGSNMAKTGGVGDNSKALWDRTGLSKGRYKYKLPLLAGAGLATYGAVKGLGKVLNWAKKESPEPRYGNYGNTLAHDVNEYGQPQRTLPGY